MQPLSMAILTSISTGQAALVAGNTVLVGFDAVGLALAVVAAQPDAQPFDVAPAVVEEMQPDLPAVAG